MTHISRRKINPSLEKAFKNAMKEILLGLDSKSYESVFLPLITKTEWLMMTKRLGTIIMLSENATYDEISDTLKLTPGTIAGIHLEMKQKPKDVKHLLTKLKPWRRRQQMQAFAKRVGIGLLGVAAKHAGGRI